MYRLFFALLLGLSACSQPVSHNTHAAHDLNVPEASCQTPAQSACTFFNAPLTLLTTPIKMLFRTVNFYPMASDLQFVDSEKKTWVAPKGTLTDGASIPPVFVKIVGAPTSQEFVNAAAIHDAYCGIGNDNLAQYHSETWQDVHRMFYDALRVGGTPPKKAKIMFAAVYIGGPRWVPPRPRRAPTQVARAQQSSGLFFSTKSVEEPIRSLDGQTLRQRGVSNQRLELELKAAIDFINASHPSIATLERFLIGREEILRDLSAQGQSDGPGAAPSGPPSSPSTGGL